VEVVSGQEELGASSRIWGLGVASAPRPGCAAAGEGARERGSK
jgi:hypothetical protein